MDFPKGNLILNNAPVQYVNFDNILNQAKKTREGHLMGYIEIRYPESFEYLFFKDGETIGAGICRENKLKEHPLAQVLDKVKKAHQGIVNIYMIDEELLNIIMALFKEEPLFSDKKIGEVDLNVLFSKFENLKFNGFLSLNKSNKYSFVKFKEGNPEIIYPLKKNKRKINRETLRSLLESEDMLISAYKGKNLKEQVHPALIELYLKFFNSLVKYFIEVVGVSLVRKTLIPSYENACQNLEILKHFKIEDDLKIVYEPFIATDEEITKAFAAWTDQFSDAIFVVLGRKTDEIIHSSLKDYRFALKRSGFFEYSKLSRLDIE
jgi:hypothetical protein